MDAQPPPLPVVAAGFKEAWGARCLERERTEGTLFALVAIIAVPAWIIFDHYLAPAWLIPFAWGRCLYALGGLGVLWALRRARGPRVMRLCTAALLAGAGLVIAWMLPRVEQHLGPYVFGFSLVFWVSGVVLSWPARWSASCYALVLAAWALFQLLHPGTRTSGEVIGAAFYIVTAACTGVAITFTRRRLERRAFESAFLLRERNRELQQALAQLSDAQARLVASEKLSALGRLLAGLSHEINNPINVIHNNLEPLRGYVQDLVRLLREATREAPDREERVRALWSELDADFVLEDSGAALETLRTAVQRLRTVHTDLRAFIRGDAPASVEGDLNEGLRTTLAMLGRSIQPGVTVRCELGDVPRFAFQPGQLNQVWLNLLQNALEAVGDAGEIAVRTRAESGAAIVEVEDSGPGVAESVRPRLFEPFVTTKPVGKGSGLGLATSFQIAQNHGGDIRLDAAHTAGARFVVRLPLRPA